MENKSSLENDKTYQFIRDLDLPAEPEEVKKEPVYKRTNSRLDLEQKSRKRKKHTKSSHRSKTVSSSNRCHSPEYIDIDTGSVLASSQYNQNIYHSSVSGDMLVTSQYNNSSGSGDMLVTSQYNASNVSGDMLVTSQYNPSSGSGEMLVTSQYNQQHARKSVTSKTLSDYHEANASTYESGEIAVSEYNHPYSMNYDTSQNLAQYDQLSQRACISDDNSKTFKSPFYSNPYSVKSVETPKQNPAALAVWDVIDPLGKVRGLPQSVPETPIFSTGMGTQILPSNTSEILTQKKEAANSSDHSKDDSLPRPLRYSKFVLYGPRDHKLKKPDMDRPPGCQTLNIFGLPERMTEDMVKEAFRKYGKISKIRMLKSSCHITFESESAIDKAIELCGYHVIIRGRRESKYRGNIHISYVPVRKEKPELDCTKQKQWGDKKVDDPVLATQFSEAAVMAMADHLRDEGSFGDNVRLLTQWMEEGKCNKTNAFSFFSVFQSMQGFVSMLMKDTAKLEEEVRQHKAVLSGKYVANSLHFEAMLKAFDVVASKRISDHFSESQCTRISLWKKYIEEIKESNAQDLVSGCVEKKNNQGANEISASSSTSEQELKRLKKENEQLKKELEAAQGSVLNKEQEKIIIKTKESDGSNYSRTKNDGFPNEAECTPKDVRLISLVGSFLNFHRYGESINSISKYVSRMDSSLETSDVERLLRKFPTVYRDSTQNNRWTFMNR